MHAKRDAHEREQNKQHRYHAGDWGVHRVFNNQAAAIYINSDTTDVNTHKIATAALTGPMK
jgi:hypothetical protein